MKTWGKTTVDDGVGEAEGDGETVGVAEALGVGVELVVGVALDVVVGVVVVAVGDGTVAQPAIASKTAHTASNNQIFPKPGEWYLMISS